METVSGAAFGTVVVTPSRSTALLSLADMAIQPRAESLAGSLPAQAASAAAQAMVMTVFFMSSPFGSL